MHIEQVRKIADAVLYEGYLLYPYRRSAIKNRQRWTIGVVYPRAYSEASANSNNPWSMQTECLLTGQPDDLSLTIQSRFLHLLQRTDMQPTTPVLAQFDALRASAWSLADRLAYEPYEEGIEREISIPDVSLSDLLAHPRVVVITFPGQRVVEKDLIREQHPISGAIRLSAEAIDESVFKLRVQIENTTPETGTLINQQNAVLLQAFISTHTIVRVQGGAFISLLEPPKVLQMAAQACHNLHTWPILMGEIGDTDLVLSSPIILYDYPQIAPESPGALFDGTEIDEILILRILTLTEDEKQQMREGDERTREMLRRTEALTSEQLMQLHGTIRSMQPVDEGECI